MYLTYYINNDIAVSQQFVKDDVINKICAHGRKIQSAQDKYGKLGPCT